MSKDQIVYAVFGCIIATALVLDLGFLSRKSALQFLVGKYLQFWGGDFAHMGVAQ